MAYMDYMDPDVLCLKKADKLTHSLTSNILYVHLHGRAWYNNA